MHATRTMDVVWTQTKPRAGECSDDIDWFPRWRGGGNTR